MAKLEIQLDVEFETEALLVDDEEAGEIYLDFEKGRDKFQSIKEEELELDIISSNEDAELAFLFKKAHGKKGSVFNIEHKKNNPGLSAKISGTFSISLRAGADSMLKSAGELLDLRLRGVTWKGGSYMGFAAVVEGGDYDQKDTNWRDTFPKIGIFKIK